MIFSFPDIILFKRTIITGSNINQAATSDRSNKIHDTGIYFLVVISVGRKAHRCVGSKKKSEKKVKRCVRIKYFWYCY